MEKKFPDGGKGCHSVRYESQACLVFELTYTKAKRNSLAFQYIFCTVAVHVQCTLLVLVNYIHHIYILNIINNRPVLGIRFVATT